MTLQDACSRGMQVIPLDRSASKAVVNPRKGPWPKELEARSEETFKSESDEEMYLGFELEV